MAFVKVGSLSVLPPGSVMEVHVGDGTYAICNAGGEIHALDGICPHAGRWDKVHCTAPRSSARGTPGSSTARLKWTTVYTRPSFR